MDYCVAQTSLAHTYGNVTCTIANYVKSLFPKNFFKTVHISTIIAYKEFSVFNNTNRDLLKKSKPMLIIKPRLEVDDSSVFLYDTYFTSNTHNLFTDNSFTNLQEFVRDPEKKFEIRFLLNRLKMQFDITIITETYMEAINQSHYLKNTLPFSYSRMLPTCLESYVPRELLRVVGDNIGIPLYDKNNSVRPFVEYINGHSVYPVSYKMHNSTGNDEFFRYYPTNIDVSYSNLAVDEVNKKGMVSDTCATTFTLTAEFNAAGLYYFFTDNKPTIDKFVMDIRDKNHNKIIPLFTAQDLHISKFGVGWNIYTNTMYAVDNNELDKTDISDIFNNSIMGVINYHKEHGLPYNIFMQIEVMKDARYLVENVEYELDLDNMELITKNCNMDSTYRIIVHVNTQYVNGLINDIYDLSNER